VGGVAKPDLIAPSIWLAAPMLPRTWVHNEAMQLWRLNEMPDRDLARFLRTPLAGHRFSKDTLRRPLPEVRAVIRRRLAEQKYFHPHYQHVDGTSMAAPIVTGLVAQMLEANPGLTPAAIKDILIDTAEPLPFVPRAEQGAGLVSAPLAVAAALRAPGGPLAGLPLSPRVTPAAITWYCYAPGAREVALVGSFNGWQPVAGGMWEARPGVWQIMLPVLPPGTHAYKFLIDRRRWVHDVDNPVSQEDGAGGFYSLITFPAP
jgi:serine protease AprX